MNEYMIPVVWVAAISCLLSSVLYLAGHKRAALMRGASAMAAAALLISIAAYTMRWTLLKRLPLESTADFLLLFSLLLLLLYIGYERKSKNKSAGFLVLLFSGLLALIAAAFLGDQLSQAKPMIPELNSPLLSLHVITCAVAYASFAIGAGFAAVQLKKGSSKEMELWVFRISAFGFIMLTLGIVLGAVWAEQAWGSYWSWDPKEIWALVTWIIYTIYFHKRKVWDAKKNNIMVILGFLLAMFTFLGVNIAFSGLHSYG